jgi:DNA-binding NarL/FixJ family response regulator
MAGDFRPRLICLDDDPLALDQARVVIEGCGLPFQTEFHGSPRRAIESHAIAPADVVLADLRLGSTNGLRVIKEMRAVAPGSVYMLLSGEADLESALAALNDSNVFRFFTKPARIENMKKGLTEALEERRARQQKELEERALYAVEKSHASIACLDHAGRILFANEPAENILANREFFSIGSDRILRSFDPEETKKFHQFLTDAFTAGVEASDKRIFRFRNRDETDFLVISAIRDAFKNDVLSLVFSDPDRPLPTQYEIATALNLTPSEARVVHGLICGGSVEEAASIAGVSLSSARTYLKNVFAKTGVSRQAELVRKVFMLAH